MVHKIGNVADLSTLPPMDTRTKEQIQYLASTLSQYYGENRNVDNDDGGFVLYVEPGTHPDEVKKVFNFATHIVEYVTSDYDSVPPTLYAHYLLNNEFAVSIIMSIADAPAEIISEL